MVECEFVVEDMKEEIDKVLIDTWWNVNHLSLYDKDRRGKVLIDTWWNVNSCITFHAPPAV